MIQVKPCRMSKNIRRRDTGRSDVARPAIEGGGTHEKMLGHGNWAPEAVRDSSSREAAGANKAANSLPPPKASRTRLRKSKVGSKELTALAGTVSARQ